MQLALLVWLVAKGKQAIEEVLAAVVPLCESAEATKPKVNEEAAEPATEDPEAGEDLPGVTKLLGTAAL